MEDDVRIVGRKGAGGCWGGFRGKEQGQTGTVSRFKEKSTYGPSDRHLGGKHLAPQSHTLEN